MKKTKTRTSIHTYGKLMLFPMIVLFMMSFAARNIAAQTPEPLRVYMDCWRCDMDYLRTAMPQINFVRNRQEGDVQILVTRQRNGAGGTEWTFTFLGYNTFAGMNDTLVVNTGQADSDDMVRKSIEKLLKQGLTRYLLHSDWKDAVEISFNIEPSLEATSAKDPWNNWVFELSLHNSYSGEKTQNNLSLFTRASADRITEDWKVEFSAFNDYNQENYQYDSTSYANYSRRKGLNGSVIKSLSSHWSAGLRAEIQSSTYENTKGRYDLTPALEYNIYPYFESTRHQFRIIYRLGITHRNYFHETVYNKISETRFLQRLRAEVQITQPWGSIETSLEGSHYLYDLKKNRLEMQGDLSLNVVRGLSVDFRGHVSMIHDQIYLEKGTASLEDVLLQRKQLATSYDYSASIGLSYIFGSVNNTVVNPRMDISH